MPFVTVAQKVSVDTSQALTQQIKTYKQLQNLVKVKEDALIVSDTILIKENSKITVNVPAYGKDFLFLKRKRGFFSAKLIGKVAGIVSDGAVAVGLASDNFKTLAGAIEVMEKANAVQYGADAVEKVRKLTLSKKAKKLVGKTFTVSKWERKGQMHILIGKIGRKKYQIRLEPAYLTGEIKLN